MTVEAWLEAARRDAARRGLDGLAPLLETLGGATRALRAADWNVAADAAALPGAAWSSRRAADDSDDGGPSATAQPVTADDAVGGAQYVGPLAGPAELAPIDSVAPLVAAGRLTAVDLVDACLARIARDNERLNAIVTVLADRARREASQADNDRAAGRLRGPLHGIPITLKDLIDVAGVPTTAASNVRRGLVAAADATVTRRLRDAGAIVIGKTNLHEFAFGTTNEDSAFGAVRHPVDPARSPGGSSGGSAAAIRAGMGMASIGTDTGGSIRIPAAACGLVGLKPAFGEVPTDGIVPLGWSLDHVGPLARTVEDAWLLCDVLRGRGPRARATLRADHLRLGLLEPYFCDLLEDGVRHAFFEGVERLRAAGARIDHVALPHASLIAPVYLHTVLAEAMAYHAPTLDRRPADYTSSVRVRLELGRYVQAEDYVRAAHGRTVLATEVDALLERCDALLLPTLPLAAPVLGESTVLLGARREPVRNATLRLTQLFDLTGHPAITLPVGDAEPGLPAGLQLAGRHTDRLLAVALACERALGGRVKVQSAEC